MLAQPVDLSTLFHPEIFINALRQRSARHLSKAIDELKLVSSFENSKIPAEVSIQLEGLWLQGSTFDGIKLNDSEAANATEII